MHRNIFTLLFFLIAFSSFGQEKTEWKEGYKLSVLDFQAEAPQNRQEQGQTYYLAVNLDFSYGLGYNKFKRPKNLNNMVTASFNPGASWLQQGEGTETLLKYAQMDFDLAELYARKYRKRLHAEKDALTNSKLFQKVQKEIKAEMATRRLELQQAVSESDAKGAAFQEQILKEIEDLAEFCQDCEPAK